MHPTASLAVASGMAVIVFLVVVALLAVVRRFSPRDLGRTALAALAWLALAGALGLSGVLTRFDVKPPPFALMLVTTLGAGIYAGCSRVGGELARRVPLWLLVGFQAFRLPLELVMHRAAREGTMPVEMSFDGYNFDIVTGASAVVVAVALRLGAPVALARAWNVVGSVLLTVVVAVAVAGSPLLRAFGEGDHVNRWVAYFPFVWLPTILVVTALAGHIVVWRALRQRLPLPVSSLSMRSFE